MMKAQEESRMDEQAQQLLAAWLQNFTHVIKRRLDSAHVDPNHGIIKRSAGMEGSRSYTPSTTHPITNSVLRHSRRRNSIPIVVDTTLNRINTTPVGV